MIQRLICLGVASVSIVLIAGCNSSDSDAGNTSAPTASEVADGCVRKSGPGGQPSVADIKAAFEDGGSEPVRLFIEDDRVRPGKSFAVVPLNGSSHKYVYGASFTLQRRQGGSWVDATPDPIFFELWGSTLPPGEVGPCVSAWTEKSARPGHYRVLQELQQGGPYKNNGPTLTLSAEFEVVA